MVCIMTLTVLFFYPETKGLPIEEAPHVFADHWYALTLPSVQANPELAVLCFSTVLEYLPVQAKCWGMSKHQYRCAVSARVHDAVI